MTEPLIEPEPPKTSTILDAMVARMLVEAALADLWMKDQDLGCCPRCCGPCWALKWLADSGQLEDIVGDGSANYYWKDGQVDREWLARAWRMVDCHEEPGPPAESVGVEEVDKVVEVVSE